MKRLPRHITVPLLLLIYLSIMAWLGLDGLRSGATSPMQYFGTIALTLLVLVLLYFFLKKRDRLRRKRQDDLNKKS